MTISYVSAPEPRWYFVELNGLPAGSGKLYTFSSLNPTEPKYAFQDASGINPWPSPIDIDENGTRGPFFWKLDSTDPDDLYNLIFYDVDGNLVWQENSFPQGVSGGGGGGTTVISLTNLINNNVFYRSLPNALAPTPVPLNYLICPSNSSGFKNSILSGASLLDGFGDIRFRKNLNVCTDQVTVNEFLTGEDALDGDITPRLYCNYTSNAVVGDSDKYYEIPLLSDVQSLSNNQISVTVWARANSTNQTIILEIYQFFGDGVGASTPVKTIIASEALVAGNWTQFTESITVPTVGGKNIGPCGNSATYLRIYMPTTIAANIDITKPCVYLGPSAPVTELQSYDLIESAVNKARTGDVRVGLNSFDPYGWVLMNDGTIGSPSSGSTTFASIDTFPLYDLIWTAITSTSIVNYDYAKLFTSAGAELTFEDVGVSSAADFTANRRLALTKQLGLAIASVGTPSAGAGPSPVNWALGQIFGEEAHTLIISEIPAHHHSLFEVSRGVAAPNAPTANTDPTSVGTGRTGSTGGSAGHNTIQPTTRYNVFMKL